MSKFISGKDLLTRLDILPFELFNHVKNGLQPFDKYGKPISPPDIQSTIKQIEVLKNERESFNRRFRWLTGEVSAEEKFKIIDRNVRYYSNEIEEEKKLRPRRETLNKDIDYLEKELKQREDKFSWRNYDLPEDERSAQFVINSLLESYFSLEDMTSNKTNNREAFISGEVLLERWPNTDEGELLEILKKGYSAIHWPSMDKMAYRFRAYHPSHELIIINFLDSNQQKPTIIKDDQVPFIVDYPKDLFPYLKRCLYRLEQIEKVEEIIPELLLDKKEELNPQTEKTTDSATNYFRRSGENWLIKYNGNEGIVRALKGFQYIAYLISKPGEPMSCYNLYHCFNVPGKMTKNEAIDQTLSIASRSKEVESKNTPEAKEQYLQQYKKLQGDLNNAESDLERAEIEKEMAEILAATKEGSFKDPIHTKAQSNVIKSLKVAYAELEKNNLKELAMDFRDNIKPDGQFGYIYKGMTWEVIF